MAADYEMAMAVSRLSRSDSRVASRRVGRQPRVRISRTYALGTYMYAYVRSTATKGVRARPPARPPVPAYG